MEKRTAFELSRSVASLLSDENAPAFAHSRSGSVVRITTYTYAETALAESRDHAELEFVNTGRYLLAIPAGATVKGMNRVQAALALTRGKLSAAVELAIGHGQLMAVMSSANVGFTHGIAGCQKTQENVDEVAFGIQDI